jgi:hypothetical protein
MDITDIEQAVDRIIAKRSQQTEEHSTEKPRKQLLQKGEYVCPKSEECPQVHTPKDNHLKTTKVDVICPARHAAFVDSLVASKKKAM